MNPLPCRLAAVLCIAGACLVPFAGRADTAGTSCLKGKQAEAVRSSSLFDALKSALNGPQCAGLVKVLTKLQASAVPGGRKLKEARPLDRAAAQAELAKARSDPEFTRLLASASQGVTDPTGRMVVEAALLDDQGYFDAHQLLMEDIAKTQEAR